ncbi:MULTISPECIES: 3-methyladenine DNA glycosylase [unclassified Campylobacter]|uniref:3-methyladenine DNA glycosylase n=1 Tax=unclassified Campylobacter TaxID=2593542 RepID=UPI0022E9B029|nr:MULTISPECIES: 3-methyladenine DNA glycosylase [unclassified Campylobacter]MDA3042778.1 3-methyladenine DNA glycosylase [Campylobacter sp. JMF_09 ED2]MDA3044387.1 3-methyladenine DNA glycosylase [Campylobacter sp. JMF_07 ED4]MDA3063733.1 3-methyladenine DNA glycosylase [Campylobacter sp. JMF_11 EL3]MDA3071362.1 3-methyladenine DNA glycosylase [Campylobacter sp. VBCF_03 NA9]MDA3074822.1 3-methyladenine DNA glycosylase [Campylobacter sp. JMF_05 ED3]
MSATELFRALFGAIKFDDFRWWPRYGEFEVIVGAILIQNTNWKNAELALENLRQKGLLTLQNLANLSVENLAEIIKASGFYNQKAKRLRSLCRAIEAEFGDFENFAHAVSREWLISQKGIGAETCDAILCYACGRPTMVVDSYALRILGYFGYEFECYDECKEWLESLNFSEVFKLANSRYDNFSNDENGAFALFHGLIVEFCKAHLKGKKFDEFAINLFNELKCS